MNRSGFLTEGDRFTGRLADIIGGYAGADLRYYVLDGHFVSWGDSCPMISFDGSREWWRRSAILVHFSEGKI